MALAVRDEPHLEEVAAQLTERGIRYVRVVESDGRLMALGVEPTLDRDSVKRTVSALPLVR